MAAKEQAKVKLELHQRYLRIARQVRDAKIRVAYEGLAQQALRHAARLDPASVNRNSSDMTALG
jgi:hypothetical protein